MTAELLGVFVTFFLGAVLGLVTIINPPATLPFFTALTRDLDDRETRAMALRACIYCFLIVVVSLFAGGLILTAFGISYGALRVAGGIVLGLLGHGMLYGKGDAVESMSYGNHQNPAFFPLAMPGITGPGTIAVVIGLSTEIRELDAWGKEITAYLAVVAAALAVCVLEWALLHSARAISKRMGAAGIEVLTRLMGFLLICIGVQFIASGIRTLVSSL
ncbi:MAG: MarC family NAAT transporter [Burkholderiaceae bacterium]|nr:MarC family NAAT transporter [Burkholderiaceae bacterium]